MRLQRFVVFIVLAIAHANLLAQLVAPSTDLARLPREQLSDPYLPGPGRDDGSARSISRSTPGSVQVNVDASGMNIVGDAANEPSIAIDPTNPLRMAIGWRQFDTIASDFRQAGWGYTTDGGQNWTFPGVLTPGTFRSDPSLAADNAGRLFYNSLQQTFCMDVFLSTNGGATWPTSATAFGGDKNWIAVARSGDFGEGNIYCVWQPGALCPTTSGLFTRSINHGTSFASPVALPNNPQFGVVTVGPDGVVYVGGVNSSSNLFVVARSLNAQNPGQTPTFTSVTGNFLGGFQAFGGPNPAGLLGQVWIAANPTNASHVYLLCSVVPTGGGDPVDVRFSRSTDGGVTWGASKRINDDPTTNGAYHWFGTMSIAPNGRLDAVWNDTRDDPANRQCRLYSSWSLDGGITWSANIAMTPPWDSTIGWPQQSKIGDYYHMISDNDYAYLAYAATFNGEQDVYFMKYRPNDCNHNGIPDNQDIANGTSTDCNGNGVPDECESDCNHDGVPDPCQLAGNDCNSNGILDECEAGYEDCNHNGILDLCEGFFVDCNHNGHMDSCDIASGASSDCNGDGVPDECEGACAQSGSCAPTSVVASPSQFCQGSQTQVQLTASGGFGTYIEWFEGACGGSLIGAGGTISIAAPSSTKTYYARWASLCGPSACVHIDVNVYTNAVITQQPTNVAACIGQSASFSISATSIPPPIHYQWRKNFVPIVGDAHVSGENSPTLMINPVGGSDNAIYDCVVSSLCNMAASNGASLDIPSGPPTFTIQPQGYDTCAGQSLDLFAIASGNPPPAYQWRHNGQDIPGAHSPSYDVPIASPQDSGTYVLIATTACFQATSDPTVVNIFIAGSGDGNLDGRVNGKDIPGLVNALLNWDGETYTGAYCAYDMTGDAYVDEQDIPAFISALLNG